MFGEEVITDCIESFGFVFQSTGSYPSTPTRHPSRNRHLMRSHIPRMPCLSSPMMSYPPSYLPYSNMHYPRNTPTYPMPPLRRQPYWNGYGASVTSWLVCSFALFDVPLTVPASVRSHTILVTFIINEPSVRQVSKICQTTVNYLSKYLSDKCQIFVRQVSNVCQTSVKCLSDKCQMSVK